MFCFHQSTLVDINFKLCGSPLNIQTLIVTLHFTRPCESHSSPLNDDKLGRQVVERRPLTSHCRTFLFSLFPSLSRYIREPTKSPLSTYTMDTTDTSSIPFRIIVSRCLDYLPPDQFLFISPLCLPQSWPRFYLF